jgi:hypothetical protein
VLSSELVLTTLDICIRKKKRKRKERTRKEKKQKNLADHFWGREGEEKRAQPPVKWL